AVGGPMAVEGERLHMRHVMRLRDLSPAGRILGDSNLEWWWEPLLIKRCTTAMLQHELRGGGAIPSLPLAEGRGEGLNTGEARHQPLTLTLSQRERGQEQHLWPDAKAWLFRNPEYCITAAWGAKHMATFTP